MKNSQKRPTGIIHTGMFFPKLILQNFPEFLDCMYFSDLRKFYSLRSTENSTLKSGPPCRYYQVEYCALSYMYSCSSRSTCRILPSRGAVRRYAGRCCCMRACCLLLFCSKVASCAAPAGPFRQSLFDGGIEQACPPQKRGAPGCQAGWDDLY